MTTPNNTKTEWKPTMELRWIDNPQPVKKTDVYGLISCNFGPILQQRWEEAPYTYTDNNGFIVSVESSLFEWRDVPIIYEKN